MGNGTITPVELGWMLEKVTGQTYDCRELHKIMTLFDKHKNGGIDFVEYVELVQKCLDDLMSLAPEKQELELNRVFEVFDRDGDGCVSRDDLFETMADFGMTLSTREISELFHNADLDQNGILSLGEFKSFLLCKKRDQVTT